MNSRPLSATGPEALKAARQMEGLLLKQLLESSGIGKSMSAVPMQQGMFLDALANAVAEAGGLGLAQSVLPKPMGGDVNQVADKVLGEPARMTSGFGDRVDPIDGSVEHHGGVDLAAAEGTPIRAALSGVVTKVSEDPNGYGRHVVVSHANGTESLYAHMLASQVRVGDRVEEGQMLGQVGSTGRSTGPHLHFEVQIHGKQVDPIQALKTYSHVSKSLVATAAHERRTP